MGLPRPFQIAIRRLTLLGIAVFLGQLGWEFVPNQIRDLVPASDTLCRVGLFCGVTLWALLLSDAIVKFVVLVFEQGEAGVAESKDSNVPRQDSRERPRVLLVEQNTALAEVIVSWLDLYDIEVLRACSGMPGFWAAVYGDPDVILCGQWEPGGNSTHTPEPGKPSSVLSMDRNQSQDQMESWLKLYDVQVSPPRPESPGFWAVTDADSDEIQCGPWTPKSKESSYIDRLQSDPRTFDIPLIVMTSADTKGLKQQMRTMGIAACLRQPVAMSEMLKELGQHIVLVPKRVLRDKTPAAAELPRPEQGPERAKVCDPVSDTWEPSVI